jgi:hypothetical protein
MNKPLLEIMPKYIFELLRAQGISRAIYEYICQDKNDTLIQDIKYDLLIEWSKELTERFENLKK